MNHDHLFTSLFIFSDDRKLFTISNKVLVVHQLWIMLKFSEFLLISIIKIVDNVEKCVDMLILLVYAVNKNVDNLLEERKAGDN